MRNLCFKVINLSNATLFVFVDRSFANNKDQSSQIGYVIIQVNKHLHANTNKITIEDNTISWSSTKYQRMTQSVLASEIYGMINRFDLGLIMK